MSKELKRGSVEVRRLEDNASQTRFTWAVIFVALVTVLVGLLTMIEPHNLTDKPFFNGTISFMYFALTIGMSYTFYAMCHTSFLIDKLINEKESEATQEFVKKYWHPKYSIIFSKEKVLEDGKTEIKFKEGIVISLCIVVIVVSLLPLLFKLYSV